jgi:hypothetical protein
MAHMHKRVAFLQSTPERWTTFRLTQHRFSTWDRKITTDDTFVERACTKNIGHASSITYGTYITVSNVTQ